MMLTYRPYVAGVSTVAVLLLALTLGQAATAGLGEEGATGWRRAEVPDAGLSLEIPAAWDDSLVANAEPQEVLLPEAYDEAPPAYARLVYVANTFDATSSIWCELVAYQDMPLPLQEHADWHEHLIATAPGFSGLTYSQSFDLPIGESIRVDSGQLVGEQRVRYLFDLADRRYHLDCEAYWSDIPEDGWLEMASSIEPLPEAVLVQGDTEAPATSVDTKAGPPYADPIKGVRVYDQADVLGPFTVGVVEQTIVEIEERSGAQIVVYTQVKPGNVTFQEAEYDAAALMEQWGVGREGHDDGLVILFDLDPGLCDGQVLLYAGTGYAAEHLSSAKRQAMFDEDMVPPLLECDFDTALLAAMSRIAAVAGVGPQASVAPSTAAAETMTPSISVEDLFPIEMGDGALTARDVEIHQTESEVLEYLAGEEPDAAEIAAVRGIAEAAGGRVDDMTIVDGWLDLEDGTTVANLGAFQIGGAEADDLRRSIHAMAMAWMGDPGHNEQEIAGRRVTVYDTMETLERVNYLYVRDDIAWLFATFEEYAADVLEALPG
jgi:uncharacterized protein